MKDRVPAYPGRVTLTPIAGQRYTYDMTRADEPIEPGDALNKANLLPDDVAQALGLTQENPQVKDALKQLGIWAKPVVGTYTGDGATSARAINLGFQPSFLIVFRANAGGEPAYTKAYTSEHFLTVLTALNSRATAGSGSYSYIDVTENGFTVTGSHMSGTYVDYYNKSGQTYGYIAWR